MPSQYAKVDGPCDIGLGPMEVDQAIIETGKVDLGVYHSEERFDTEREIFGRVWLNVAEVAEIPNAGDWIVRDVKVRSASAIIVRGKDGAIRAFHNICSHRGMKLVWDAKGRGGKFACPYHAWTFDSAGALTNIPDQACFKHVDQAGSGLTPIRCEVWEGLIFINLDETGTQSLDDYLGPVKARLKNVPFASYPYTGRVGSTIKANWKLAIEAQCEAYHAAALHSKTVSKFVVSKENPNGHFIASEFLGAHRMSSSPRNLGYECSPQRLVQLFSMMNATQMVVDNTGSQGKPTQNFETHPDINVTASNMWAMDHYILYPNFIIAMSIGGWWLHRFWPVAPDECYWEAVWHFERPVSLRNQFSIQASLSFNRDTLMEDNVAVEQQQQILKSGGRTIAQFGEEEMLCKHLAAVSEAASQKIEVMRIAAE